MTLREVMEERGLSPEDVAALLEERGVTGQKGGRVSAHGVKVMRGRDREVPAGWREALGLDTVSFGQQLGGSRPSDEPQPSKRVRSGEPPTPPSDAKILQPELGAGARKRIAGAYKFAGAMLATGTGSEGVAHVWGDQSDQIAQLWIDAAADNPYAARFVELMNSGGAMGDVVAAHLYLVGGTLYVLGARIPAGDTIFSKYEGYRVKPKPAGGATSPPGAAGANGAGQPGQEVPSPSEQPSAGPVGHSPG